MLSPASLQAGLVLCGLLWQTAAAAEIPFHQQVDEQVRSIELGPVAERADDATFLRRVSLDLIGRVPTRAEVEAFLADEAADKRTRVVDDLLGSPEYARHMAVVFDLMLMERRGGKHVKSADFRSYLERAFAENRSYVDIVREILLADGTDEKNRAAAAFYLERDVEPHLLTRDVGRIFYGIDLQCAQCHNHPLIDDYHQPDYYGLHAFFVRSSLFQAADKKSPAMIAEQATGESDFKSVFTDREGMMRPRIPGGQELLEVTLKATEEYQVAPAKDVRPIPTQSRREQLAAIIGEQPSSDFNRNIANRLWAHMFGRGLVDPVDLHHAGNPPSNPQLLDLLAARFSESNYDIKFLLRELALTNVYQRSFRLPPLASSIADAAQRIEQAQATATSTDAQATAAEQELEQLLDKLDEVVAAAKPFREAEASANKQVAEAAKTRDAAQAKVTSRQAAIGQQQQQAALLTESIAKTKAASEALKEDKELATALSTIEGRAAAHQAELAKAEEALTAEQQQLTAAQEALQAASTAADAAIAARVPPEQSVLAVKEQILAVRANAQRWRQEANLARRDVESLETLLAYDDHQQQIARLTQAIPQREQQIVAQANALTEAEQRAKAAQVDYEAAQAAVAAQEKQREASTTALQAAKQTQSRLAESISSAETAQQALATDEPLTKAIVLLKESLTKVDADVVAATANLDQQQAQLEALQAGSSKAAETAQMAQQSFATLKNEAATLNKQLADDRAALASRQASLATTWDLVVEQSSARGNACGLTALTPEQLALSLLTATGEYDRQRAAAAAKLGKEQPLSAEAQADPAAVAQRAVEIDQATRQAISGTIASFVKLYGADAGQPQHEFFATAEQSLFAANGSELKSWLQPSGGRLTEQLLALEDVPTLARSLYLSILSRPPSVEEIDDVQAYLASRGDQRQDAVQELAWGLLTSAEFRFRH